MGELVPQRSRRADVESRDPGKRNRERERNGAARASAVQRPGATIDDRAGTVRADEESIVPPETEGARRNPRSFAVEVSRGVRAHSCVPNSCTRVDSSTCPAAESHLERIDHRKWAAVALICHTHAA